MATPAAETPTTRSPGVSMELLPGKGLGPFYLGSPISDVIAYMRKRGMEYRRVQVQFSIANPYRMDICLVLSHLGLRLRFCSYSQRLKIIDVFQPMKIHMSYDSRPLGGPDTTPTFSLVSRVLGPTFPGRNHTRKRMYMLQYPGVCALFPLKKVSTQRGDLTRESLEQADPVAVRFFVHVGKTCQERLQLPPLETSCFYLEPVVVRINTGIRFAKRKRSLLFQRHTLQHVMSSLGMPDQVYVKDTDSMRIHRSPLSTKGKGGFPLRGTRDYFLNYFKMGMDILICGTTHKVSKIILHTNMPATRNFNRYNRCNYQIMVNSEEPRAELTPGDKGRALRGGGNGKSNGGNGKQQSKTSKLISFNTSWTEIQRILGPCGRPMVYGGSPGLLDYPTPNGEAKAIKGDKAQTGPMILGGASELNRLNPFKPTYFYAYAGIIFEVLPNDYIASIILFST
uniref:Uncharacterized protein n=1 Tax=Lotharella oceanica TaxID=641309 RepID=A0A7S2TFT8_9EUKA